MPIFTKEFLSPYLKDFRLSSVTSITRKKQILGNWHDSILSRKLEHFKEEEVKSRFILELFGEVLGFNYKDAHKWQIREELKSVTDATKPDAAIGLFHIRESGIVNEVHLVIEIKDTKSKLDKPQNRKAFKLSPLDQAFLYATKTDGRCKWVVVSNFREIRFYSYQSQSEFQQYLIADLQNEDNLKEFLFLFSKERLINSSKSTTDKLYEQKNQSRAAIEENKHILDQVYDALHGFDGLSFIDPEFLCTIKPFNILNEHVWHYKQGCLISLNSEIAELLEAVEQTNEGHAFKKSYLASLKKAKVSEGPDKLRYIFGVLRNSMVREFCAVKNLQDLRLRAASQMGFSLRHFAHVYEGKRVAVTTLELEPSICHCIHCRYRRFDFRAFIRSLQKSPIEDSRTPLEDAYGEYLLGTDDFKKAYYIYKSADIRLQDDSSKKIDYFISKINQMRLHNLVEGYSDPNSVREILQDIKTIDLDRSIHSELDTYVDSDVRKYLIEIKENKVFLKIAENIEDIHKELQDSEGKKGNLTELDLQYKLLYSQFHKNFLVFDAFEKFKTLASKVVEGFFIGFRSNERALNEFPDFYLTEAILYVDSGKLKNWLEPIETLNMSRTAAHQLADQAINLLQGFYNDIAFGPVEDPLITSQMLSYHFQEKYSQIINNTFTLLSKVDLLDFEKQQLSKVIYLFLITEKFLSHFDLKPIGNFILRNGDQFKENQLHSLLQHAIDHDNYRTNKYSSIFSRLCGAYAKYFPNQFVQDKSIVKRAVANATHETGRTSVDHLVPLYAIVNDENKQLLLSAFEENLERDFSDFFFYQLIEQNIIGLDHKDYFQRTAIYLNRAKGPGFVGLVNGAPDFKSIGMINLIYKIYRFRIPPNRQELALIGNLSEFERWAIDPAAFDPNAFNPEWLLAVNQPFILSQLGSHSYIGVKLNEYLKENDNSTLARIYFQYFSAN